MPLGVFFLAYGVLGWPYNVAAGLCLLAGVVSMFAVIPLTALIYTGIIKLKRGKVHPDTVVHSTDTGCSSLVFLVLFLMIFPVFEKAKRRSEAQREKYNTTNRKMKKAAKGSL